MRRVGEESPESSRIMLGLLDAVEQDRAQSQRLLASELGIASDQAFELQKIAFATLAKEAHR